MIENSSIPLLLKTSPQCEGTRDFSGRCGWKTSLLSVPAKLLSHKWRAGKVSVQILLSEDGNLGKCFGHTGYFFPYILPEISHDPLMPYGLPNKLKV